MCGILQRMWLRRLGVWRLLALVTIAVLLRTTLVSEMCVECPSYAGAAAFQSSHNSGNASDSDDDCCSHCFCCHCDSVLGSADSVSLAANGFVFGARVLPPLQLTALSFDKPPRA